MIDWKRKLASRKFWALLCGVTVAVGALLAWPDARVVQITALITAVGSVVGYILGEAYVDGKRAEAGNVPLSYGGDE